MLIQDSFGAAVEGTPPTLPYAVWMTLPRLVRTGMDDWGPFARGPEGSTLDKWAERLFCWTRAAAVRNQRTQLAALR